jgi:hypothetical protein
MFGELFHTMDKYILVSLFAKIPLRPLLKGSACSTIIHDWLSRRLEAMASA